jgi:hypothetical protein
LETPGYCQVSLPGRNLTRSPLKQIGGNRCPSYFAENLNTVFDRNVSPGFKTVDGKLG